MTVERHAEDIRALGPGGVFYTSEDVATLHFSAAIGELERDFAESKQYVRLSDLLERCCRVTGVAFEALPDSLRMRASGHAARRPQGRQSREGREACSRLIRGGCAAVVMGYVSCYVSTILYYILSYIEFPLDINSPPPTLPD